MDESSQPHEDTAEITAQSETIEQKPEPRKYKVKVDGNEAEVDETELINSYQKGRSADKKFQEAAEIRKQLETFVDNVKANPNLLLEQLGHNPKEWARQLLLAEIEEEAQEADPNLRRIAKLEKQLSDLVDGDSKRKQEKEEQAATAAAEAEVDAIIKELDEGITASIEALGIKTTTVELVADIAEQMLAEHKLNKSKLSPNEAFNRAKNSFSNRLKAYAKNSPEALLELVPEEYLDGLAEKYLAKRKPKSAPSLKTSTPAPLVSKDDKAKKSLDEFFSKRSW